MNIQISISGAHRTGKSKLCQDLSKRLSLPYLESSTTKILSDYGYAANENMRYPERLNAQLILAREYDKNFEENLNFVTDRCHFDFMLYSYMEVGNDFPYDQKLEIDFNLYIEKCIESSKKLDALYLLQPGIPIFKTDGKASSVKPLLDKLNLLALGLIQDHAIPCTIIPKNCLDLESRIAFVTSDLINKNLITHQP